MTSTGSDESNVHYIYLSDAEELLAELRTMRNRMVTAWQKRGVTLLREEQERLRQEIADTCAMLTELTRQK